MIVVRIEGGRWHSPGFEPRSDAIWDGELPPLSAASMCENNEDAIKFIEEEMATDDVFIVTTIAWRAVCSSLTVPRK